MERLDDLDALLRADAESADNGVGIERKRVSLGKPAHPPRQRIDRQPPAGQPAIAEDHVLGHRTERGDQEEMLMHHADAQADRIARRPDPHALTVDAKAARVGHRQTRRDIHQRRLAGAVLDQQPQDLAGMEPQADIVVGQHPRVGFGYAPELEDGRGLGARAQRRAAPNASAKAALVETQPMKVSTLNTVAA